MCANTIIREKIKENGKTANINTHATKINASPHQTAKYYVLTSNNAYSITLLCMYSIADFFMPMLWPVYDTASLCLHVCVCVCVHCMHGVRDAELYPKTTLVPSYPSMHACMQLMWSPLAKHVENTTHV